MTRRARGTEDRLVRYGLLLLTTTLAGIVVCLRPMPASGATSATIKGCVYSKQPASRFREQRYLSNRLARRME